MSSTTLTPWQKFYNSIKGNDWPDCPDEEGFSDLPADIRTECVESFGYIPGSFKKKSKFAQKVFPIKTETACQLKWNWSTIFLTSETTASCHRTDHHKFDLTSFDFHNTPRKINDRERMLAGLWPKVGCDYCKNIENAGGISDRITNLDFPGIHAPMELDVDPTATKVTPRILEVYFDNTCNLKCLYCIPQFSSLWDAENIRFGDAAFVKSSNIESNKEKLFEWLKINRRSLTVFNILGGEPLYQEELIQCLELFEKYPAPEMKLQMFTNLNTNMPRLVGIIEKIKRLIDTNKLKEFEITASIDCWGVEQEYVRFPLNLTSWEENFNYVLSNSWINLIVSSVVTPLTIKTLPDLLGKVNEWNKSRTVYHYQNSVNSTNVLPIDIFGDIFKDDFRRALDLKLTRTPEEVSSKNYLLGIASQANNAAPNVVKITNLFNFLNKMDHRRMTNWRTTFPWLVDEFSKYKLV